MGFGNIMLRVGSAWIVLNLAAIVFFSILFLIERAWIVVLSRRITRSQGMSTGDCIPIR